MTIKDLLEYYGGYHTIFIEIVKDYEDDTYKGNLSEMPYKYLYNEIDWWAVNDNGLEIAIK